MNAPVPLVLQSSAPPFVGDWMGSASPLPNPPVGQGYSLGANVPVVLQSGAPPTTFDWMRSVSALPNPPPGQGYLLGGGPNVPVHLQSAAPPSTLDWMRGVSALPNPGGAQNLSGWYPSTSSVDYQKSGPPVAGAWVEQLDPKLPARGLLHRQGAPLVKVQILWNAGCELKPGNTHTCNVYVQEMGPADLVRFRLATGQQGRAKAHRVYKTPSGNYTDNPRVLQSNTRLKTAWLPASSTPLKPAGIRGSWVQISTLDPTVGIVRIPGVGVQNGYVFETKRDAYGRLRALVRWRATPAKNPAGNAYLVQSTINKDKWYCRVLPHAADCVRHDITRGRRPNPLALPPTGGTGVSAAAARASVKKGGILDALVTGKARVVADRQGIRLVS